MQNRFLVRGLLLFLISICFALALQNTNENKSNKEIENNVNREKRFFGKNKKPGFFRTLFSVLFEQWNDTKNTLNAVNKMISDNFLPDRTPITTTTTTVKPDPNITTTQAPYKITRTEFGRIFRRNFRGLVRLFNIELKDALKQSDKNYAQFKKNVSLEVSKFL